MQVVRYLNVSSIRYLVAAMVLLSSCSCISRPPREECDGVILRALESARLKSSKIGSLEIFDQSDTTGRDFVVALDIVSEEDYCSVTEVLHRVSLELLDSLVSRRCTTIEGSDKIRISYSVSRYQSLGDDFSLLAIFNKDGFSDRSLRLRDAIEKMNTPFHGLRFGMTDEQFRDVLKKDPVYNTSRRYSVSGKYFDVGPVSCSITAQSQNDSLLGVRLNSLYFKSEVYDTKLYEIWFALAEMLEGEFHAYQDINATSETYPPIYSLSTNESVITHTYSYGEKTIVLGISESEGNFPYSAHIDIYHYPSMAALAIKKITEDERERKTGQTLF